ncbi:MAG: phosphoribosylformylglycinamidine synthase subunit PurS, partial [Acidobacteriota bacterium]
MPGGSVGGMMKAEVFVTLKSGVLDPQGKVIARSLRALGFEEVRGVRQGKYMVIDLEGVAPEEARKRLDEMCQKLLANTVIENYRVRVEG